MQHTDMLRTRKGDAIQDILLRGRTNYRGKIVRASKAKTQADALEAILRVFPKGLPRGPHPQ